MSITAVFMFAYLIVPLIVAVALYWVIRLAVRHALADAAHARTLDTALPGARATLPAVTEPGTPGLPPSES